MDTDITIENGIATWILPQTQGDVHGTYTGTFQFRCYLDPIRQLQAGREYRELIGPNALLATETEGNLAFALTQLKHRILKSPPFWSSTLQDSTFAGNIGDLNIITMVLDAAIRAENLYKEMMTKERDAILERNIKVSEETIKKQSGEQNGK
jgi:hypothetical protein